MAARRFMKSLAIAAAVVLGAAAQQAHAQNWDGSGLVKFGVFLQGSLVDYDISRTTAAGVQSNAKASPDGLGVGISAGYDLRLGSFIVGAEADISTDGGGAHSSPRTTEQYGVDFFSTVRGRLGYVITPALMVYGTAGYSMLGAEYKQNATAIGTTGNKRYGTLGGVGFGGGLEYDLGWGIGFFEYLHTDFSSWSFRGFQADQIALDAKQDVFRLGLKFKIGHDFSHDVYKIPDTLK